MNTSKIYLGTLQEIHLEPLLRERPGKIIGSTEIGHGFNNHHLSCHLLYFQRPDGAVVRLEMSRRWLYWSDERWRLLRDHPPVPMYTETEMDKAAVELDIIKHDLSRFEDKLRKAVAQ